MTVLSLDPKIANGGGLLNGGGVNRSQARFGLSKNQAWNVINAHPTAEGYTNDSIGYQRKNTNKVGFFKVQGGKEFNDLNIVVIDGRVYSIPLNGGDYTSITATNSLTQIFDSNADICFCKAIGTGTEKLYICDGVNNPYSWDGTSLVELTVFNSAILGKTFTKPLSCFAWRQRVLWTFNKGQDEDYVLGSVTGNADSYVQVGSPVSIISAFFTQVEPGNGEMITCLKGIKQTNLPKSQEALIAYKETGVFRAAELNLNNNVIECVFTAFGGGSACVNRFSAVNYNNDVWSVTESGLTSILSDDISGDLQVDQPDTGLAINEFLIKASENETVFKKTKMIICPKRSLIMILTGRGFDSSANQYSFSYPEIPLDRAICMRYKLKTAGGIKVDQWYTREGAGWGFSCAWVVKDRIFLGSYFGNIGELFIGDDYEIPEDSDGNPLNTGQAIESCYETGDWTDDENPNKTFELIKIIGHWKAKRQITTTWEFAENEAETGLEIPNVKSLISNSNVAIYGKSNYGEAVYGGDITTKTEVEPSSNTNEKVTSVRIKIKWMSKLQDEDGNYYSNTASLFGLSGRYKSGKY